MKLDYTFLVGGEAGQGLQTIGTVLSKALARQGLHVFANQDYYSRVRGGHNFFQIRATSAPIYSFADKVNVLVALDEETIKLHRNQVAHEGVVVYDSERGKGPQGLANYLSIPLSELGKKYGGRGIMGNAVAVGAVWDLMQGGFACIDILQPCVVFNKVNTFKWYKDRVYDVHEAGHNPSDLAAAFHLAGEWGEKIPTGIFFAEKRQTLNQALLGKEPDFTLVEKDPQAKDIEPLLQEYL